MKCNFCQKNESIINSHLILNGKAHESGICKECYDKILGSADLDGFMSTVYKMVEDGIKSIQSGNLVEEKPKDKCIECGMLVEDILTKSEFGCPNCFKYLQNSPEGVVLETQSTDIDKLKSKLLKAIEKEEYEEAAKIRDEIKCLEADKNA